MRHPTRTDKKLAFRGMSRALRETYRRAMTPTKGAVMPRLTPIDPATATGEAKELLDGIQAAFGSTPNSFRAMANNPGVLKGWIELSGALGMTLPRKLGEQI